MNDIEKLVSPALQWHQPFTNDWIITIAGSYPEVLHKAQMRHGISFLSRNQDDDQQGFFTTARRFVPHNEGVSIAKSANQLKIDIDDFHPPKYLDGGDCNFASLEK